MELLTEKPINLNLNFVNYYLLSKFGRSEIFKHVKATAQPSLSMGTIRYIDYIIPPEQHAIAEKVDRLIAKIDMLEQHVSQLKARAEQLTQAVLREALEVT
ncbi:restriction endonuclease subunit S [candidate division KSB1 bacterium]|nr:restriction endonuclease subunit S [candidate division KSB1 bacterium]